MEISENLLGLERFDFTLDNDDEYVISVKVTKRPYLNEVFEILSSQYELGIFTAAE